MKSILVPVFVCAFISFSVSLAIPITNLPPSQQHLLGITNSTSKPLSSTEIRHGSFININHTRSSPSDSSSSYIHALHTARAPYLLLERCSDELFALGLLLLVPVTLGIVELIERLSRALSVEEFPGRGREKRRLLSMTEREEWVVRRKEREMKLERSRSWWKWSRRRA